MKRSGDPASSDSASLHGRRGWLPDRLRFCIALGLVALAPAVAKAAPADEPVYDGARPSSVIDHVATARLPLDGFPLAQWLRQDVHDAEASSRSSRVLLAADGFLGRPLSVRRSAMQRLQTQPEGFFLLWDEQTDQETGVLAASFQVECPEAGDWTLGLGCEYAFAVEVNDRVVHGRGGYARFGKDSDLVTCHFQSGRNRVTVLFVSSQQRAAAVYGHPWTARLELFRPSSDAVNRSVAWNSHPFDCPIVRRPDSLRTRVGAPFFRRATLRRLDGTALAKGEVRADGTIAWSEMPPLPEVVVGEIDGITGEPLLFADIEHLSPLPAPTALSSDDVRRAWTFRYNHLLAPEYVSAHSTLDWANKVAYSRASAERPGFFPEASSHYPGLQFGSFRSALDGSVQYYQYYRPVTAEPGAAMPLLVVVPGVTDPVRPFLESVTPAGFEEWERWCAVAAQHGCALLWPGYNDVDYGGEYARAQLAETLDAFLARNPNIGPVYLLGTCSASIATSRFAAEHPDNVAGAIFFSPELRRGASRITPGIEVESMDNQFIPEGDDSLKELVPKLAMVRVGILFDSGMPGHGDRAMSDTIAEWLKSAGGEVRRFSAPEAQEYVWGERMVWRLDQFLSWMEEGRPAVRRSSFAGSRPPRPNTALSVKQALLNGFSVDSDSFGPDPWLSTWAGDYRQWRSAELPRAAGARGSCRIERVSIDDAAKAIPRLNALLPKLAGRPVFALVRVSSGDGNRVLRIASSATAEYYPRIDPLLDGYFTGTLWVFDSDRWEPVATW